MMLRRVSQWLARDDGATAVLFALALPILVGVAALTIDASRAFVERRELQNAVDSAALAAAVHLPSEDPLVLAEATDAAIEYAALNGLVIGPDDVVFSTREAPNDTVTIYGEATVEFVLARIFGVSFGAVGTRAAGQLGSLAGMIGVMPWGLEEPEGGFVFGETYCLKLGSGGQGGECDGAEQGNFQALDIDDLGNDSADIYRDRIINGSQTWVRVGDVKNISRGNMQGPTMQGVGCTGSIGRIVGDTDSFDDVIRTNDDGTYTVLNWDSPRLVIIPQVEVLDSDNVEVVGFLVFFIEGCTPNGAVLGRFIDTVVPGGEWEPFRQGSGSRVVRLVE